MINVLLKLQRLQAETPDSDDTCLVECNNVVEQGLLGSLLGQTSKKGSFCIRGLSLDFDASDFKGSRYLFAGFNALF